jgi:hypothetical protein
MAITFALAGRTRYGLSYVLTQDGGAGNNVTITSVDMRVDLVAGQLGGPLLDLLNQYPRAAPATTGNEASRVLLGADSANPVGAVPDLENVTHCRCVMIPSGGTVADWKLTGVAAVATTEVGVQVVSALVASDMLLQIQFSHTFDR